MTGTDPHPDAPEETPLTAREATEELQTCPECRTTTGAGPYCENCGAHTTETSESAIPAAEPAGTATPGADASGTPVPETDGPGTGATAVAPPGRTAGMLVLGEPDPAPVPTPAPAPAEDGPLCECGGGFADGYCEQCGAPLPDPRGHVELRPTTWVAGVSDVGVRHESNQDSMAIVADEERAALVVCDGVSSALRSEEASQAAADAAVTVLSRATSTGVGVPSSLVPALSARVATATDAAADAVAEVTRSMHAEHGTSAEDSAANPSCTFVAAAIEGGHVVVGSVGDSRAYWFPDAGEPVRLTVDDSWAEEQIAMGATREQAENGPGAHTITRWLGVDCTDHAPRTTAIELAPGWLVVCSDGLWNYASEPAALAAVLNDVAASVADSGAESDPGSDPGSDARAADRTVDPLDLARGLVTWANARGGHDNITVVVARPDARKAAAHG